MKKYFLGVDIGGTKSHALIADETGGALSFSVGGPGSHEAVGYEGLAKVLQEMTREALAAAGLRIEHIAGAGFGVGGYNWPAERAPTLEAIATLGLHCPLEAVNDTVIGLLAGASQGWGVALVAGTGENCWGWDRQRRVARVTGNGVIMGEYGGAITIVFNDLQADTEAWSKRGQQTALSQAFLSLTGASNVDDLLEGVALQRYPMRAAAAPVIFQVAEQGDLIARQVLSWAGHGLADLACGVIRQLAFEALDFDLVLVGSVFDGGPLLLDPMCTAIHQVAPKARYIRLAAPPVVGGVLLGIEVAGLDGSPRRARLLQTTMQLM